MAESSTRLLASTHAKLVVTDDVTLQGELDGVREMFDGGGDRWQLAAYAGPVWFVARGIHAGVAYQAFAEDLRVRSVLRQGGGEVVAPRGVKF